MRKIKARQGADAAQLREELAAHGLAAVKVGDPDAQGEVQIEVPKDERGPAVDVVLQRHVPRSLLERIRSANSVAQIREPLLEVLHLLMER